MISNLEPLSGWDDPPRFIPLQLPIVLDGTEDVESFSAWEEFKREFAGAASLGDYRCKFEGNTLQFSISNMPNGGFNADAPVSFCHPVEVLDAIYQFFERVGFSGFPRYGEALNKNDESVNSLRRISKSLTAAIFFHDLASLSLQSDNDVAMNEKIETLTSFRGYCDQLTNWLGDQNRERQLLPTVKRWYSTL